MKNYWAIIRGELICVKQKNIGLDGSKGSLKNSYPYTHKNYYYLQILIEWIKI